MSAKFRKIARGSDRLYIMPRKEYSKQNVNCLSKTTNARITDKSVERYLSTMKISIPVLVLVLLCGLAQSAVQQVPTRLTYHPNGPWWVTTKPTVETKTTRTQRPPHGHGQYYYHTPPSITPKTERPTRRPPIKLEGRLTPRMCLLKKYKHLRACFYVLNKAFQPKLEAYTRQYLCKEQRAKEQKEAAERDAKLISSQAAMNNRALGVATGAAQPRFLTVSNYINPCTTSPIAESIELIEVEDMNGNIVELLADIENQLFQTFYTKDCSQSYSLAGFECKDVHAIIETSVWVDVGEDNDPENDVVTLKKVKIPVDCALHLG